MDTKTISRQIAEFTEGLTFDQLPEAVVHETKRYLYDSVGCAFGAMDSNRPIDVFIHEISNQ